MTQQEGGVNGPDPNEITRTTPIQPEPPASLVPQPVEPAPATAAPASAATPGPIPAEPLTPPVYEATVAWAPAEPVVKAAGAPRRRRRLRWAVALAMVAIIITTSAAVAALIVGRSPDAVVLGYVPENSIAYVEVRLDSRATSASPGQFLSVPGVPGPGRPRWEARRGARPAGQGRHQRRAVVHGGHQALVQW
jgi:hypothetical protein